MTKLLDLYRNIKKGTPEKSSFLSQENSLGNCLYREKFQYNMSSRIFKVIELIVKEYYKEEISKLRQNNMPDHKKVWSRNWEKSGKKLKQKLLTRWRISYKEFLKMNNTEIIIKDLKARNQKSKRNKNKEWSERLK